MRYQEGRAWITACPLLSCQEIIIEAHLNGIKLHLAQWSIPVRDAEVLMRYERIVVNVRIGPTQLWAESWWFDYGAPDDGRLYARHIHGLSGRKFNGPTD